MAESEPMNRTEARKALAAAVRLQYRSVLQYGLAAASIGGLESAGLAERLRGYAAAELADLGALAGKLGAIGGEAPVETPRLRWRTAATEALEFLVETEAEALEALSDVIPASGTEAEGEALEHVLEHMIMRKHAQLDDLRRLLGS